MSVADRLTQEFDITPEKGIELQPLPQETAVEKQESTEDQETTEELETTEESHEEETAESQVEETEVTDEQDAEGGLGMSVGQFANAAGVTLKDIYSVTMPDGRTLSQAVDEGREQQAALQQLQTERSQLQEQLQKAQTGLVQGDDQEVMKLETAADLYQQALENADFSTMEQGEAANYRLNQMNTIAQLRQAAQAKRGEHQVKQSKAAVESLVAANTELLGKVPEWSSQEVYGRENKGMGDFLRNRGFTDNDLFGIDRSPKYKLLVRDAWKALAKQEEIKKGAKKVRKISKTLKPGAMKGSAKTTLKEVAKTVRQADTRQAKQKARLSMEFDR